MRLKPSLGIAAVYAVVALLIFASDGVPLGRVEDVAVAPMLVSLVLLLPLTLWYRRGRPSVASVVAEREGRRAVWAEILVWLASAMVVRVPFVLLVGMAFEKTPLIYLLVLTVVLVRHADLGAFGFQTEKLRSSLVTGLAYYLVFAGGMFGFLFTAVYVATGHVWMVGYAPLPSLLVFPFMTCCVGVSEEGLFRGVIQTRLARAYSPTYAVWVQAVLFGLWHVVWHLAPFDPISMSLHVASSFAFGWVFGRFFQRAGNLVPLILAHGLVDTVGYGAVLNPQLDPLHLSVLLSEAGAFVVGIACLALLTTRLAARARAAEASRGPQRGS